MDEILHADAVDDETIRVELNGAAQVVSLAIARELSRHLDAAIDELRPQTTRTLGEHGVRRRRRLRRE